MNHLLILGNQLFSVQWLKKHMLPGQTHIYMLEDRQLCTYFRFHKHKIILFLSAMRHYAEELKAAGYTVHYLELRSESGSYFERLEKMLATHKPQKLLHFEVEDHFFEQELATWSKSQGLQLKSLVSPMFLCPRATFKAFKEKYKKPMMARFYESERKRLKILVSSDLRPLGGKWSFDAENRNRWDKKTAFKAQPFTKPDAITKEVMQLVDEEFADHPGKVDEFWCHVTRRQALAQLDFFVQHHLEYYGPFQDAIVENENFLFHSILSPYINMGLIFPSEAINAVATPQAFARCPASVEGFVRQVMGWREFVRGIYHEFDDQMQTSNFFKHEQKLGPAWWVGKTGIPPLDNAIQRAHQFGYLHHIERLMVVSNLMLLSQIHPQEVYRWFMEMFVDSSDWVMAANVFGMGQFSEGGIFASKPYIAGSNYLLKMSHYKKGEWCATVDGLYWSFIDRNREFFKSQPRLNFSVNTFDKFSADKKAQLHQAAADFIRRVNQ